MVIHPPNRRSELGGSGCCSELAGLAIVGGKTPDNNYNPLFSKAAPHSPISSMPKHKRPQLHLGRSVSSVAGASSMAGFPRGYSGASAAVNASFAATRSPVSTAKATAPKAQSRSSWPPLKKGSWGKVPMTLKSSSGDDETETSSNALLSAATSTATEHSFDPRPTSGTRNFTALHQSPSSGLWGVEEVPEGSRRSSRVSHGDATQTAESVTARHATQSRPNGAAAAAATKATRARPSSPLENVNVTGVEGSKPLSGASPDGEAGAGEAETGETDAGGVETSNTIKTGSAGAEVRTPRRKKSRTRACRCRHAPFEAPLGSSRPSNVLPIAGYTEHIYFYVAKLVVWRAR